MSEAPSKAQDIAASLTSLPSDVVDGGEVVILALKPSMWRPFTESLGWMAFASTLALVIGIVRVSLPGISIAATAQLMLLIGLARLGLAIVAWIPRWHVLTNRRLMSVSGVRSPRVASLPLQNVSRTDVTSSLFERVIGLGTVRCTGGVDPASSQSWQSIASPEDVQEQINRAIDAQSNNW